MEIPITSLFVGIFLLFLVLTKFRPGLLAGSVRDNFIISVIPITTLLFLVMAILESRNLMWWMVYVLGVLTTISYLPQTSRFAGITSTWALLSGGLICLFVWAIHVF